MKKTSNILWGILLLTAGILLALNALGITNVDLFFDGWWTLFIIVPSAIGLITDREKTGNLIVLLIGVFLLLCCQGVLNFALLWKLLVPGIIIIIGLKMLLNGIFGNRASEMIRDMKANGTAPKAACATFAEQNVDFSGQSFEGAELTAVFGSVNCDLRHAVIEKDCAIQVSATFGGITILVPDYVNVKVNSNSLFGGFSNKTPVNRDAAVTIYVSGTCMFGGVEIK